MHGRLSAAELHSPANTHLLHVMIAGAEMCLFVPVCSTLRTRRPWGRTQYGRAPCHDMPAPAVAWHDGPWVGSTSIGSGLSVPSASITCSSHMLGPDALPGLECSRYQQACSACMQM